ncbi:MAG: polyprenol monophosphomannose synthase [Chloroflexota bacterium]
MQIIVIIPTYNEADNLPLITQALFKLSVPNLHLLIVDDNSPDGTGNIAEQLAATYGHMSILHREGKGGLGTAYIAGMKYVLENHLHYDYIVQMDADFSHSPDYIPQLIGVMDVAKADVVIGSRYVPGGTLDEGWGAGRRLLSWWANLYCRIILQLRIRDMTAGFKVWRREALQQIDLGNIGSNGYSFQVEMAYVSEKLGFRIIELPIHFEDRRIGQSKLDIPIKVDSAWRVWQILWRYRHL